jgi:hypothetical protein
VADIKTARVVLLRSDNESSSPFFSVFTFRNVSKMTNNKLELKKYPTSFHYSFITTGQSRLPYLAFYLLLPFKFHRFHIK